VRPENGDYCLKCLSEKQKFSFKERFTEKLKKSDNQNYQYKQLNPPAGFRLYCNLRVLNITVVDIFKIDETL